MTNYRESIAAGAGSSLFWNHMIYHKFDTQGIQHAYLPCAGCTHRPSEHLFLLGPLRLCMEGGCSCGRRALAAAAHALAPYLAILAAAAYMAWHLYRWAGAGFRVVG